MNHFRGQGRARDLESVDLVLGDGGVFLVKVDDRVLWDKKATGRFPEHTEVLGQL